MYYVVAEEKSSVRYVEVIGPFKSHRCAVNAEPWVKKSFREAGSEVERMDVRLLAPTAAARLASEEVVPPEALYA
jgi:hypothetical protein